MHVIKTYLLPIPEKISKKTSLSFLKKHLCSNRWRVFNDEEIVVIFEFQKKGNLIITDGAEKTIEKWMTENMSEQVILIIDNISSVYNPICLHKKMVVFQNTDTKEHLCLIPEYGIKHYKTIDDISNYFLKWERQMLKMQRRAERKVQKAFTIKNVPQKQIYDDKEELLRYIQGCINEVSLSLKKLDNNTSVHNGLIIMSINEYKNNAIKAKELLMQCQERVEKGNYESGNTIVEEVKKYVLLYKKPLIIIKPHTKGAKKAMKMTTTKTSVRVVETKYGRMPKLKQ